MLQTVTLGLTLGQLLWNDITVEKGHEILSFGCEESVFVVTKDSCKINVLKCGFDLVEVQEVIWGQQWHTTSRGLCLSLWERELKIIS
jgi:hypothetical protein